MFRGLAVRDSTPSPKAGEGRWVAEAGVLRLGEF